MSSDLEQRFSDKSSVNRSFPRRRERQEGRRRGQDHIGPANATTLWVRATPLSDATRRRKRENVEIESQEGGCRKSSGLLRRGVPYGQFEQETREVFGGGGNFTGGGRFQKGPVDVSNHRR